MMHGQRNIKLCWRLCCTFWFKRLLIVSEEDIYEMNGRKNSDKLQHEFINFQ